MMHPRTPLLILLGLLVVDPVGAATYTSSSGNFVVRARRMDVAESVGEHAERYRREKALEWLGFELPPWPNPCAIAVRVTHGGAGGATSFAFENGEVLGQDMTVEGPLERILNSVLPHEVTHTIFAAKFRRPLPRWADEGGAVLSEDAQEIARHDRMVRELINSGRMISLGRLFVLTEYPNDVMALYAQGFSVARYLASLRGRRVFLDFVWDGQQFGWENVVRRYYGFASIPALEQSWIQWLIAGYGTGADRASLAELEKWRTGALRPARQPKENLPQPATPSAARAPNADMIAARTIPRDSVTWIAPAAHSSTSSQNGEVLRFNVSAADVNSKAQSKRAGLGSDAPSRPLNVPNTLPRSVLAPTRTHHDNPLAQAITSSPRSGTPEAAGEGATRRIPSLVGRTRLLTQGSPGAMP